ncbi:putative Cytochrome P450-DIT2 (putative) [Pseudozyma hubeiensis]|nr:putative Cytochrome P450-DIT2 (putative) [Pseudozyma hubeiensis]
MSTDAKGLRPRALEEAHKRYGDIVRTGPREISVNAPSAIIPIMGSKSSFWRGPWYAATAGARSPHIPRNLHSTIIEPHHSARRKVWDAAFSAKALKGYETMLIDNMENMVDQLEKRSQRKETVNIDDYCSFYSFDVMSQAGFAGDFGLLKQGQLTPMIQALEDFMSFVQLAGNLPYLVEILGLLPNPIAEFDKYMNKIVMERKARKEAVPDIMEHLLHGIETEKGSSGKRQDAEATADARLMIVAGSDTSSTTMAVALFFLMENPTILRDLREELLKKFGDDPMLLTDFAQLDERNCPLLNAIINESLRIIPPVPTGLQRESPSDAIVDVNGRKVVIPANTIVTLPIWSLHRDPRNFSPEPLRFRPGRWLEPEKEERFNKAAFTPFSFGKTSCVGKVLAYMEVRLVIANLVRRFDFEPADHYDAKQFQDGLVDAFVTKRNYKLPVHVKVRSHVGP